MSASISRRKAEAREKCELTEEQASIEFTYTGIHMCMYMDSRNATVLVHSHPRDTTGGNRIITKFR